MNKPDPLAVAYKQGWTTARNEWKPRAEKAEAEVKLAWDSSTHWKNRAEKAEAELKRLWKVICDREPAVILRDDQ